MPISDQKMKKLKVAMVALLLGFTIYLCFRNYKLNQQLSMLPDKEITQHTDTIYLRKDFLPISYDNLLNPSRIPVSYTHLDVYKRQIMYTQIIKFLRYANIF